MTCPLLSMSHLPFPFLATCSLWVSHFSLFFKKNDCIYFNTKKLLFSKFITIPYFNFCTTGKSWRHFIKIFNLNKLNPWFRIMSLYWMSRLKPITLIFDSRRRLLGPLLNSFFLFYLRISGFSVRYWLRGNLQL